MSSKKKVTSLQDPSGLLYATIHDPSMGDILNRLMSPKTNYATDVNVAYTPPIVVSTDQEQSAQNPPFEITSNINMNLPYLLSLDDDEFIKAAYSEFFGRNPDSDEYYYFSQSLRDGVARVQVLAQIAASGETASANTWYKKFRWPYLILKTRRLPVIGWFSELACAFKHHQLQELLIHNDDIFIIRAFQSVLGRMPDPNGFEYYLTRLRSGHKKISILINLRVSNEGKIAGNRVAGLTALSWLSQIRHAPIIKWIIDIITLPSVAISINQQIRGMELSIYRFNLQHQYDVAFIKESLKEEQLATLALSQQLDRYSASATALQILISEKLDNNSVQTNSLINHLELLLKQYVDNIFTQISKEDSALFRKLYILINDMQVSLSLAQSQAIGEAIATILAQFSLAERREEQLRNHLDQHTLRTATLISQESAAVSKGIYKLTSDLQVSLNLSLSQVIEEARTKILAQIALNDHMQEKLRDQLDLNTVKTVALIKKECAIVSNKVQILTNKMQTDISSKLKDATKQLNIHLPRSIEDTKISILAQVLKGKDLQVQISESLPKSIEEAKQTILDRMLEGKALQVQFSEKLDNKSDLTNTLVDQLKFQLSQHADITTALISKESEALYSGVQKITNAMQAELSRKLDGAGTQLSESLPKSIEEAKQTILDRMLEGEALQVQFSEKLDNKSDLTNALFSRLNPKLDRIELYGMSAARRISVPCSSNSVMIRTNVGYTLCANDDHALISGLIESGELERGTRQLIQRIIGPNDVFIDVGANIGMHSLAAAQSMQGQGRVVAFEPYPPTAQLLKKTVLMNGFSKSIEINCAAVAAERGERILYLGATSGHHSLYPLDELPTTDNSPVKVEVTTVDHIMGNSDIVNLFKIDAEGAELEILAGATKLLKRNKDIGIIAEFGSSHLKRTSVTPQDWLEHFTKLGFIYQAIHADTGLLNDISIDELNKIDSINLFFARPKSPIWKRARGVT